MSNYNQRQNIYIHPQNQQLLWNTMNKTPMFSHMNPQIKDSWFKGIIQQFYNSNQHVYDAALLQQINKETISYMVTNLKGGTTMNTNMTFNTGFPQEILDVESRKRFESLRDSVRFTPTVQGPPANTVYRGKEDERALKQEEFNKAFEERQNQYFLKKPPMPDIDFTEKLDDRPITNMEELIQMHQKEREYEINKYSPLQNILPEGNPISPINTPIHTPIHTPMVNNTHESLVNKLNILTDNYEKLKIMMEDMNKKYDYLVSEIKYSRTEQPKNEEGRFTEGHRPGVKSNNDEERSSESLNITLEEDKDI